MEVEYKQWLFITVDLKKEVEKILHLNTFAKKYEGQNIISHWLLYVNQRQTIKKYDNFPLLPRINLKNQTDFPEEALELVKSIKNNKKIFPNLDDNEARDAVLKILQFIEKKHNDSLLIDLKLEASINGDTVSFGNFSLNNCQNLLHLQQITKSSSSSVKDITRMIMRYESLGNGGYQWSSPKELYRCYYNDYGIRYEGFSSPFNSSFIGLSGGRFCSLFPDTDTVFGSMGNFFNIVLADYPGGWLVNPPFIEDIVNRASAKVIQALDANIKSTFICTLPYWRDCDGWIKLKTSRHTIGSLNGMKCLQSAYGELIFKDFGVTIFCLSYDQNINMKNIKVALNVKYPDVTVS